MAVCHAPVSAQDDGATTGRAHATVAQPLRVTALSDLSFGAIVIDINQAGKVVVPAGGGPPSYANSAQAYCTGQTGCRPHRADFAITGESERIYSAELPTQVAAKGATTNAVLIVDALVLRSLSQPNRINGGRLDQSGQDRLFIGGTLRVPPGTRSDVFRASLPIMVAYD